ncbi:MAG: helix-turn-helix transcriptional regulator [Lachnoclostridium sp.]|nr:helix-turn-helix transcriptional regulator [Lachnoclostridium sp.]
MEKYDLVINSYIEAAKAFSRCTYQCVYLYDCMEKKMIFISKNIKQICGLEANEIRLSNMDYLQDYILMTDLYKIKEAIFSGLSFIESLPEDERLDYTICCDFHLKNKHNYRMFRHIITPLCLDERSQIRAIIGTISFSSNNTFGSVKIKKPFEKDYFEFDFNRKRWLKKSEIILTEMEIEVLGLSTQGYTMTDIAKILCRSIDTVKAYKRNLFKKMGVNNITEAIVYVQNHKIL